MNQQSQIMECYLVGGAVRDYLLGLPIQDRDWVVVGQTPETMIHKGFRPVGKGFPVFLHPETQEEYALARKERKTSRGYHGFDWVADPNVTLKQDLFRRDLTINAMAMDLNGNIIDPYNGQKDLKKRHLTPVSDAFAEDPLRLLRLARFAAQLGEFQFQPTHKAWAMMQSISASRELNDLPGQRIAKELNKALATSTPLPFFNILQQANAFKQCLLPYHKISAQHTFYAIFKNWHQCPLNQNQRFAISLYLADINELITLCDQLKCAKVTRQLAELFCRYHLLLTHQANTPHSILNLLKQTDAFRKPQRFGQLLECAAWIKPDLNRYHHLQMILDTLNYYDYRSVIKNTTTKAEIPAMITQQRLQLITEYLSNQTL